MAKPGLAADKPSQESEIKARTVEEREAALRCREEALEHDLKKLNITRKYLHEMEVCKVAAGEALSLDEIGKNMAGIELVSEIDRKQLDLEQFMQELVVVNVYPDGQQGALDVILITVNGTNQGIIRGKDQRIKRKYIEALARSRIINYVQEVPDPTKPENIQMKPLAGLTYPFNVREDKNPRGPAWLDSILRQPI